MRFNVRLNRLPTIENMIGAGATALHVTARKTLLFDRDELIALAHKNSVSIVGVER